MLAEAEWLESLGSFVCSKPPSQWTDAEEDRFCHELSVLAGNFQRVESIVSTGWQHKHGGSAIRVAITHADGSEVERVVHLAEKEEEEASRIEVDIARIFGHHDSRIGVVAASRLLSRVLCNKIGEIEDR